MCYNMEGDMYCFDISARSLEHGTCAGQRHLSDPGEYPQLNSNLGISETGRFVLKDG